MFEEGENGQHCDVLDPVSNLSFAPALPCLLPTFIAFSHIPYLPGRLSLVGNATLRVGLQGPSRDMKGSARIVTSVVSIIEGLNYIGIGHLRM